MTTQVELVSILTALDQFIETGSLLSWHISHQTCYRVSQSKVARKSITSTRVKVMEITKHGWCVIGKHFKMILTHGLLREHGCSFCQKRGLLMRLITSSWIIQVQVQEPLNIWHIIIWQMQEIGSRLFGLAAIIAHTDRVLQNLQPVTIEAIGDSKAGKSTLYNNQLGLGMVGNFSRGTCTYVPTSEDDAYAKMNPMALPQTSYPKLATRPDGKSQLDSVGFKEKRNYLGMFALNYSHQQVLKVCKKILFEFVVRKEYLESPGGLLESVLNFVNLFGYETMPQEAKVELLNSTSLVVTRTSRADEQDGVYLEQLQGLCEEWKNPEFRHPKKELCIEILLYVIQHKRVGYFTRANRDKEAPSSTLVEQFLEKGWTPFDIEKARNECESLISNNFPLDFRNMSANDQDEYQEALTKLNRTFTDGAKVFTQLIQICLDNFTVRKADFSQVYEIMREVVGQHDQYNETQRELDFRMEQTGMSLAGLVNEECPEEQENVSKGTTIVQRMNNLMQFIEIGRRFECSLERHESTLEDRYKQLFNTTQECLFKLKDICCFTRQQGELLINFSYILLQGIRTLHKIEIIDPDHACGSNYKIEAAFVSVFDQSITEIRSQMIDTVFRMGPKEKEQTIFVTPAQHHEFIVEAEKYVESVQGEHPNHASLIVSLVRELIHYLKRVKVYGKSDMVIRLARKTDGLMRNSKMQFKQMDSTLENENKSDIEAISDCYLLNHKIMGEVLMADGEHDFAIQILKDIGDFRSVEEAYRHKLDSEETGPRREEVFLNYADFCSTHGNIPKALDVLREAISEATNNHILTKFTEKITNTIKNQGSLMEDYLRELQSYEPFYQQEREEAEVMDQIDKRYPPTEEEAFTEPDVEQESRSVEA